MKQSEAATHQALAMPLALVSISRRAKCIERQAFEHGDEDSEYQRLVDPCAERVVLKPISVTAFHRLFDFGKRLNLGFTFVVNCSAIRRHDEGGEGGSILSVENPATSDEDRFMSSRRAIEMQSWSSAHWLCSPSIRMILPLLGRHQVRRRLRGHPAAQPIASRYSRGSMGSLSSASTPKAHSCTRRRGSRRTKRCRPSMPSANSRSASASLPPSPRCRRRSICSGIV